MIIIAIERNTYGVDSDARIFKLCYLLAAVPVDITYRIAVWSGRAVGYEYDIFGAAISYAKDLLCLCQRSGIVGAAVCSHAVDSA